MQPRDPDYKAKVARNESGYVLVIDIHTYTHIHTYVLYAAIYTHIHTYIHTYIRVVCSHEILIIKRRSLGMRAVMLRL